MKCLSVVCILLVLPSLLAAEMTLESARARYLDAIGGMDRFRALQTLSVHGTLEQNGNLVGALTLMKKRPKLVRATVEHTNGTRIVQGFDGETAWARVETEEQIMVGPMKPENSVTFIRNAPIENALVNPALYGATLEYLGLRPMEAGVMAHVIAAQFTDGTKTEFYLDSKTFIERKSVTFRPTPDGTIQSSESIPSDYRRIDGILVAFRNIERHPNGDRMEITLQSVEFNVGLFDALFASPVKDESVSAVGATSP